MTDDTLLDECIERALREYERNPPPPATEEQIHKTRVLLGTFKPSRQRRSAP